MLPASDKYSQHRHDRIGIILLLLALTAYLLLHFTTGPTEPISDDVRQVSFTKGMESAWQCFQTESFGMFRPVKNILFYIFIKQEIPFEYTQWVGAGLAVFCSLITWLFLRSLFVDARIATVGAVIWLYSPLNVVIFNWASAMNIATYYGFSLLCILLTGKAWQVENMAWRWISFSTGYLCLVAALLSYEMAITLPLLVLLYLYCFRREHLTLRRGTITLISQMLAVLGYLYLRQSILGITSNSLENSVLIAPSSPWQLSFASSIAYLEHLKFLFWPFSGFDFLVPIKPAALLIQASLAWIAILLACALGLKCFKRFPYFLFAALWSAIALAPILNVIPIGAGPICEYYMPLAALGWIIALVALSRSYLSTKKHLIRVGTLCGIIIILLSLMIETASRETLWQNKKTFYSGIVNHSSRSYRAYAYLANMEFEEGDYKNALTHIETAMEMAPWSDSTCAIWLGFLLQSSYPVDQLTIIANQALVQYPQSSLIWQMRGDVCAKNGDIQKEMDCYQKALTFATTTDEKLGALNRLGLFFVKAGNFPDAIRAFEEACRLAPNDQEHQSNLQQAYREMEALQTTTQDAPHTEAP